MPEPSSKPAGVASRGMMHRCHTKHSRLSSPGGGRVPGYHTPEPAAIALGHAVRYAEWRARPLEDPPTLADVQRDAGLLLGNALLRGADWLTPDEVRRLLGMYGVGRVDARRAA